MDPRRRWMFTAGAIAALAAGSLSTAVVSAQEKGADAKAPSAATEDAAALVKSLADPDFATREKAYAKLKEAGASARAALEDGAKSEDAQIRWSAGRLLGLLEGDKPQARRHRVLVFGGEKAQEQELDESREDGSKEDAAGGRDAWPSIHIDMGSAMEDLRSRMRDLQKEIELLPRPSIRWDSRDGAGAGMERTVVVEKDGERTELHVGADGKVKVTLAPKAGAGGKEEIFEAESMEALAKEHPEVHAKVKDLAGEGRSTGFQMLLNPGRSGFFRTGDSRPALGVMASDVPELLREHLPLLPKGEGVVVEEVLPTTPAERLGLHRHDIVLGVNGIPVSSAADLREAVQAVKEGGDLRLKILRAGKVEEVSGLR